MTRYQRAIVAMVVVILLLDDQGQEVILPSVVIGLLLGVALYVYWPRIRPYVLGPKRDRDPDDEPPYIPL